MEKGRKDAKERLKGGLSDGENEGERKRNNGWTE